MNLWAAAHAAGLLLARVDAGVLDESETLVLRSSITTLVGAERLSRLEVIWRAAQATADDDAAAMIRLAHSWCSVLGIDPDRPDPSSDVPPAAHVPDPMAAAKDATPEATDAEETPGPLADLVSAVTATLTALVVTDDPDLPPAPEARTPFRSGLSAQDRQEDDDVRQAAERAAHTVFSITMHSNSGSTSLAGTRTPTEGERISARRLARALRAAGTRERVATTSRSGTPPGRLSMRGAMAADAQRAAGASVTAEPFTRTSRRHVPTPPLRLGIACDVSGSMTAAAPVVASTAWILNRAVGYVPDARAATVIYGKHVRPITRPGQVPATVTEFHANDGIERFTQAVDALDAALGLTRPGAARLLVIVSDGIYTAEEEASGRRRISRLRASGCGVLWIALDDWVAPMPGARLLILTDPATVAEAIAHAATEALHNA